MDSLRKLGDQFHSIDAARVVIRRFTLDDGESFRVIAFDKKNYIISCKAASTGRRFQIRATKSTKGVTSITVLNPHTCCCKIREGLHARQKVGCQRPLYSVLSSSS
jgi:hypothetical protein